MKPQINVTVELEFPFEHEGRSITSLTFRRMKAKDALTGEGEGNEIMAGYHIFAALADVPVEVIGELDLADLEMVAEEVAPLMGKRGAHLATKLKAKQAEAEVEAPPGET